MKRTGRYSTIPDGYRSSDWGNNHAHIPINMSRYAIEKYISNNKKGFLGKISNSYWDHWDAAVCVKLKFKEYEVLAFANLEPYRFQKLTDKEMRSKSVVSAKYAFAEAATIAIERLCLKTSIKFEDADNIDITCFHFRRIDSKADGLIFFGSNEDASIIINPTAEELERAEGFESYNIEFNKYKGQSLNGKYIYS
tara:strand:- start:92 stop:676 length:585 start_codon:yes stop_codon:yes gene_type:complete